MGHRGETEERAIRGIARRRGSARRDPGRRLARLVIAGTALAAAVPVARGAGALERPPLPTPEQERILAVAGRAYDEAGWLQRFLFGHDYRRLWATPFRVEVLDLAAFGGGLTPVRAVGQAQSRGLAFAGADGRSYTFRPLEKDATAKLEEELRPTIAGRIAQDQIAAMHPAATVVASALLDAAGVPNAAPRLVVLPDDERLGAFRGDFAGGLGTIQEYPLPASAERPGFLGATGILSGEDALARLRASPADRVDARAFLRARLMDLFLGDWDRHLGQWRFARVPGRPLWQPIPEDRDWAFCRFEGLVVAIARNWRPRWVEFGEEYPGMLGLTWQAWPLDRLLLSELGKPAWDEIAADLVRRLTDEAIEAAVARLPPEYRRADGARLSRTLRGRRDRLREAADRFYRFLAEEVRVEGTDEPEVAEAVAVGDGDLEVRLHRADPSGAPAGEPFFRRRFARGETDEVRLLLRGGADRLSVRGRSAIRLRVAGGEGDDRLDDSAGGGARLADWEGDNRLVRGPGTEVDTRPYAAPPPDPERPWIPPRDWGRQRIWLPWFGASPEIGVLLGGGARLERFGFRTHPHRSRQTLLAAFATAPRAFKVDYAADLRRESSGVYLTVDARASQLEILRFFGFGNETRSDGPDRVFRVEQRQLSFAPRVNVPLRAGWMLSVGPSVAHAATDDDPGRLVGRERPYGVEGFGQLAALAEVRLERRDLEAAPSRGLVLAAGGSVRPALWDVREPFGEVHAEAATYLTAALPLRPTLALRAGVRQLLGTYPFHEATFVGGPDTVRGFSAQRFAGDGGAWGNAEVRLLLGRYFLVLPGEYGVFALADAGRVWLDGEASRRWHACAGGGLWFAYVERANTVSVAVARSAEGTGLYLRTGFLF